MQTLPSTINSSLGTAASAARDAAYEADAAFTEALVDAYGEDKAGDARYPMTHVSARVNRAKSIKLLCDSALHSLNCAMRS